MMKLLGYLWASPVTCVGLLFAAIARVQGGEVRVVHGVVEAHGGVATQLLRRGLPLVGTGGAMTLGHVVLGRDAECLHQSRAHERVHVRQFERWGPLLIPAYLLTCVYLKCRGRDAYLDNPFERAAFEKDA